MNEKYLSKVANIQLVNVLLILDDIYRSVLYLQASSRARLHPHPRGASRTSPWAQAGRPLQRRYPRTTATPSWAA